GEGGVTLFHVGLLGNHLCCRARASLDQEWGVVCRLLIANRVLVDGLRAPPLSMAFAHHHCHQFRVPPGWRHHYRTDIFSAGAGASDHRRRNTPRLHRYTGRDAAPRPGFLVVEPRSRPGVRLPGPACPIPRLPSAAIIAAVLGPTLL